MKVKKLTWDSRENNFPVYDLKSDIVIHINIRNDFNVQNCKKCLNDTIDENIL